MRDLLFGKNIFDLSAKENLASGVYVFLKFGPPIIFVTFLYSFLTHYFNPWEPAQEILNEYKESITILTPITFIYGEDDIENDEHISKTYIIFDFKEFNSKSITIVKNSNVLKVYESDGGIVSLVIFMLSLLIAIWKFWTQENHT